VNLGKLTNRVQSDGASPRGCPSVITACMSDQSSAGQRVRQAADRIGARIAALQAEGKRISERVPARLRRAMRRTASLAFFVGIGWVLYRQLEDTDWPEVMRSLPTSPWFYVFFLARYFILPVTEVLCYSAIWATNLFRYFGAFLIKRILNTSVAGASGDVYFLLWAVQTLGVTYRQAFSAVKDVTLLSAAAANSVATVVLGAYLAFGDLTLIKSLDSEAPSIIIGVTLAAMVVSLLVIGFRGKVLSVGTNVMWRILGYHGVRSAGSIVLLGLQWTAGLPGSVFTAWISLLVVDLLIARMPLLPAKELIFLSLALHLAEAIDAPEVQLTAMFLADAALRQIATVPSLIAGVLWRSKPHAVPVDPDNGS